MKPRFILVPHFIFLFVSILIFLLVQTAFTQEMKTCEYKGIRPTDPEGRIGLRNPERGWRTETIFGALENPFYGPAVHVKKTLPPEYEEDFWVLDAERHEPYGLTVVQTYCYLSEYRNGPISKEKLEALQKSLDILRARGLKALLRFAYEKRSNEEGATPERILQHIDQLEPIVRKNIDVIYVLQAGFIGAWGEWHSAEFIPMDDWANRVKILQRVLKMLPEGRMTQVRVPRYKSEILKHATMKAFEVVDEKTAFSNRPAARIGFNNDGFLAGPTDGGTWPEKPLFGFPGNPEFDYMTKESPYLAVDGELFWSDTTYDGRGSRKAGVDGFLAALRLREHHYNTFSIAHSYSIREGKNFSIDYWLSTPISKEELIKNKMPISDGWFEDNFGNPVKRTQFEYITDHLGYRLELQKASFTAKAKSGDRYKIEIALINRGFATLYNLRPVYITFTDPDSNVFKVKTGANPQKWQPFDPKDKEFKPLTHFIKEEFNLPKELKPGWYKIGLWMPDAAESLQTDSRYAVRVANRAVPWWTKQTKDIPGKQYGINILGSVQILP